MTLKIPKRTETIKRRIEEYENYLKAEKRKFGGYDDSGGIRYLIGPYYMLAGDLDGALKHYKWFTRIFHDDIGEPGQYLCWTLALYKSGDFKKAYLKFLQTLLMNPHVIARVIGIDYKLPYKPSSNIPTKEWADYIPPEIYNLWDEEATAWLKESFYAEKTQSLLQRHDDIEERLEAEPYGPERDRLIDELFRIRKIEAV